MSSADVGDRLAEWARGLLDVEAGIAVLLECTVSSRLVPLFVQSSADSPDIWVDPHHAFARVRSAGLSGGERRLAFIVLELLGLSTSVALADLLAGIGDRDIAVVLNAIAHTADWHERNVAATVTGQTAARPGSLPSVVGTGC